MKKKFIVLLVFVFLLINSESHAQCNYVIPANVNVISEDSLVDCSFLVTQTFLICPGATLTMEGNSTCFNKFFVESGATIVFNDTFPVPYGSFSFYLKAGSTLHFNSSSPIAFFIDTLVYEEGVTMIDTGSVFFDSTLCAPLIFDYSLLGGAPCITSVKSNLIIHLDFNISPSPFKEKFELNLQNTNSKTSDVIIYDLLGKELEHFTMSDKNSTSLKMNNDWSGLAIIVVRTFDNVIGRKMIYRYNL